MPTDAHFADPARHQETEPSNWARVARSPGSREQVAVPPFLHSSPEALDRALTAAG